VKLTTHLHPVPRLQNVWSYASTPPIRLHAVVLSESTGITLPLPLPLLLWRCIGPSHGLYLLHKRAQHRKTSTYIHALSGIRTHGPSFRTVQWQLHVWLRGHWDRHVTKFLSLLLITVKCMRVIDLFFPSLNWRSSTFRLLLIDVQTHDTRGRGEIRRARKDFIVLEYV